MSDFLVHMKNLHRVNLQITVLKNRSSITCTWETNSQVYLEVYPWTMRDNMDKFYKKTKQGYYKTSYTGRIQRIPKGTLLKGEDNPKSNKKNEDTYWSSKVHTKYHRMSKNYTTCDRSQSIIICQCTRLAHPIWIGIHENPLRSISCFHMLDTDHTKPSWT